MSKFKQRMIGSSTIEYVIIALGLMVLLLWMLPEVWDLLKAYHDRYITGIASPEV